jgi:alkylation response protein AidB-like acyl-CoA dehydrogenase
LERNFQLRRELLAEVEAVAPILAEHAADSEGRGRLNAPSIEALHKTRLLRFMCPKERGGEEADPVTQLEIIEALAKIDGSAGWSVGILAGVSMIVAAFLPLGSSKRIFANSVPPMAGMLMPRGRAQPVDGGYRISGTWSFGSGIHHAEWVLASAAVPEEPLPAAIRVVVLPREQVVIHDNWQVAGLKASGSCDYSIDYVFVPEAMTFRFTDMLAGAAVAGGAALKVGVPALVMPFHFGIALGIARRALDEVTVQAIEKSRGRPPSLLATQAQFQFSLGKAEVELAAARALAIGILSAVWEQAGTGSVPPPAMQAEVRAAGSYVTEVAQRVTTVAFQSVGGGALFDTNPLQRCFRDVYAAGQHFMMSQSSFRALGQFKLDQPEANPLQ